MRTNNWIGPYPGQWDDPNNWSLGVPNDFTKDVVINSGGGDLVLLNNPGDSGWANSVTLGSNFAFSPSELQISNNDVIFSAVSLNINQSGVFRATNATPPNWWPYPIWVGDTSNAGQMFLTGTTMQNDGNLNNSGTMSLMNSTLNVGGSLNNSGAISVGYSQIQGSVQMMPGSSLTVIAPLQVSDLSAFQVIPASTRYDISADVTEIATGQSALRFLTEIDGDLRLAGQTLTVTPTTLGTLTLQGDPSANYSGHLGLDYSNLTLRGDLQINGSYGDLVSHYGFLDLAWSTLRVTGNVQSDSGGQMQIFAFSNLQVGGNLSNGYYGRIDLADSNLHVGGNLSNAGDGLIDLATTNLQVDGSLTNDGELYLSYGATLQAGSLTNNGEIYLWNGATLQPASLTNNGYILIDGGGTLNLPSGITQLGGDWQISGSVLAGGNNAFAQLYEIDGVLGLHGQTLTVTPTLGTLSVQGPPFNSGQLLLEDQSNLTLSGDLHNIGGNLGVYDGSNLHVSGNVTNDGFGDIYVSYGSTLQVDGMLTNNANVSVIGTLNLTNPLNGITDVPAGSFFYLGGTFTAGGNNGFYQLASVEGTLYLANGLTTMVTPANGTLTIAAGGEVDVMNNSTLIVNGKSYANIDLYGTLSLDPSTVIVSGSLILEPGSTFNLTPGDVLQAGNILNKGLFAVPGGATIQTPYFASQAQTTLNPQATLLVGTGTTGNTGYYQLANGTLGEFIDMNGFGVIVVNGPVHLDGTLDVQLASGFSPKVGATYDFITFTPGSYDGSVFASILNSVFNNGTEKWVVIYNNAGGYVELMAANNSAVPEPASLLLLGSGLLTMAYGVRRRMTR